MDTSPWSKLKSELYAFFGRNPRSNRTIATLTGMEAGDVVLDIGCGPGAAIRTAAPPAAKAIGVDRSEAMVDIARRPSRHLSNASFEVARAESLPFPDATFDIVWTIHAFHHWEDPDQGISEALRVLRPGGRFLIVEHETNGTHGMDRRRAESTADRLRAAGFAEARVSKRQRQLVVTGTSPPA